MIFKSERIAGMYGGLGSVVNNYQGLLTGILEIGTAVGLIGVLCFSSPSEEGFKNPLVRFPFSVPLISISHIFP